MKRRIRYTAALMAAITAMSCTSVAASADRLSTADGITYRVSDSGERLGKYTGWAKRSNGGRYYYKDGVMAEKWVHTGGNWYYIDRESGALTGEVTLDGSQYRFDRKGRWDKVCRYGDGTAEDDPAAKLETVLSRKSYGGIVYEDGMFIVMSVGGKAETAFAKRLSGLGGVMFRPVENSLYKLQKTGDELAGKLAGKWYGYGVDVYRNKVVFDVDEKYLTEVQSFIADNGYENFAAAERGYPIELC